MKRAIAITGIVVALAIGVGVETGEIGVYNGLNKGVTVGNCGFEVVGEFGPFCGDY